MAKMLLVSLESPLRLTLKVRQSAAKESETILRKILCQCQKLFLLHVESRYDTGLTFFRRFVVMAVYNFTQEGGKKILTDKFFFLT